MSRPRLLIALVVAAAAGYAVVRAALDGGPPARPAMGAAPAPASSSVGATADRSPGGAVAAASNYLQLLDEASPTADASLRAVTLPPLTAQATQAEAAAVALTRRLSPAAFVRGWRLGWRVDSYQSTSATVALWAVGVVAGPTEVVAPDWSTTVCTLRWSGRRWRLSAARTVPGPTPPTGGADPSAVATFARAAFALHPFQDAP